MIVRKYEEKDILRINELGKYFDKDYVFNLDVFSFCIVLEYNSYIIGFAIYSIIYDRAEINYIIVDKEYQNKGNAKIMMEYIISDCIVKKCLNITLEVNEKNSKALKLYEKYDFKKVSIRKNYYNNEDAYLMEKVL